MKKIKLGVDLLPLTLNLYGSFDYATLYGTSGFHTSLLPNNYRADSIFKNLNRIGDKKYKALINKQISWDDGCYVSNEEILYSIYYVSGGLITGHLKESGSAIYFQVESYSDLFLLSNHNAVVRSCSSHKHRNSGSFVLDEYCGKQLVFTRKSIKYPFQVTLKKYNLLDTNDALIEGEIDITPPLGTLIPVANTCGIKAFTKYVAGIEISENRYINTFQVSNFALRSRYANFTYGTYDFLEDNFVVLPLDIVKILWVDFSPNYELLKIINDIYHAYTGTAVKTKEIVYNRCIKELPQRRTPSCGALNSVEAMIWVNRVEKLEKGWYEYDPVNHALGKRNLPVSIDWGALAYGQRPFLTSAVTLILYHRSKLFSWKYTDPSAYEAIYAEVGAVIMALSLQAAEIGISVMPTNALQTLNLDKIFPPADYPLKYPLFAVALGHKDHSDNFDYSGDIMRSL